MKKILVLLAIAGYMTAMEQDEHQSQPGSYKENKNHIGLTNELVSFFDEKNNKCYYDKITYLEPRTEESQAPVFTTENINPNNTDKK